MKEQLALLAIQETPAIIDGLRALFVKQHPAAPVPTSAEIILAYQSGFVSSLLKDDAWRAAHPE